MPDEDLAAQLSRLRAQAGGPSVRVLAKLTERQGSERAMSRSTIQDKLSGRNPPRLRQVLALVQACADYANSIGPPLPAEETDEQIWRERTQAASRRTPRPAPADISAGPPSTPKDVTANSSPRWNLGPLIRAGLDDMVDLVQARGHEPMADWLPILIEALREAEMSTEYFLAAASKDRHQDAVRTILALAYYQENKAADRLLFLCAVNQPAESIPIILALLRRKGEGRVGVELAERLLDIFTGKGSPGLLNIDATRYVAVVSALRQAAMNIGAARLLKGLGEHGPSTLTLEVAASYPDTISGDRNTVLTSAGKRVRFDLYDLFRTLRRVDIDGLDPQKTRDHIIFAIPGGNYAETASYLKSMDMDEEAERILKIESELPF
jgi:hypothetical protein